MAFASCETSRHRVVLDERSQSERGVAMWPYDLMRPDVGSCPECGNGDIERMGGRGGNYRYACFEGHQFEVPKPQNPLSRWLRRRSSDEAAEHVDGGVRSRR